MTARQREAPAEFYETQHGPVPGLYPTVLLGDGQWEHVIRALRATGTKRDAAIADRINKSVQSTRRRRIGYRQ